MNRDKNYSDYTLYDFLMDAHFKKWATQEGDDRDDAYWLGVMDDYPAKRQLILSARKTARSLKNSTSGKHTSSVKTANTAPALNKAAIWQQIQEHTQELSAPAMVVRKSRLTVFYRYAAVVAVIGIAVMVWFSNSVPYITVTTGNAETKTLVLPDHSVVQLAANSTLRYPAKIQDHEAREIFLSGTARFQVVHLNRDPLKVREGERFIVHLAHKVNVEVLGTTFSVDDRRGKAQVNLESGSVKIYTQQQQLLLKPGETAETQADQVKRISVQQHRALKRSWQQPELLMDRITVSAVIAALEDNYGLNIRVEDPQVLEKQLDGSLPLNDEHRALRILSSITGTHIDRKLDSITLSKP